MMELAPPLPLHARALPFSSFAGAADYQAAELTEQEDF
jgi:hypothetical protein